MKRLEQEKRYTEKKEKMKRSTSLFVAGKMNQVVTKRTNALDKMMDDIESIYGKISIHERSKCTVRTKVYRVIDAEIEAECHRQPEVDSFKSDVSEDVFKVEDI